MSFHAELNNYHTPLSLYKPLEDLKPGKSYFSNSVVKLLHSTLKLAQSILADAKDADSSKESNDIGDRCVKVLDNGDEPSENEGETRFSVGLFFASLFKKAIFEMGKIIGDTKQLKKEHANLLKFEKKILDRVRSEVEEHDAWPETHKHIEDIEKIVKFKKSVLNGTKTKNYWKLALTIGLVVGAILGLIGALASSGLVLVIAALVVVIAVGSWFLKRGLDSQQTALQKKAAATQELCKKLLLAKTVVMPVLIAV